MTYVKWLGLIGFLGLVVYEWAVHRMVMWDLPMFLVILGISAVVWDLYRLRARKWDFFARNVSIFVGMAYGALWTGELVMYGQMNMSLWYIPVIPIGYGVVFSILFELAVRRKKGT